MLPALMDIFSQVLNIAFDFLIILSEIGECLKQQLLKWLGLAMPEGRIARTYVRMFLPCILRAHRLKQIKNMIYHRIGGHAFFFCLYVYHYVNLISTVHEMSLARPELKEFCDMFYRYFTVWNLLLHIAYTITSLVCDISTALKQDEVIPEWLRNCRFTIFAGLIWPASWIVFTLGCVYLFTPALMMPEHPVSCACNFLIHGWVVIHTLWEMIFLPKHYLKNTSGTFHLMVVFLSVYNITMFYTRYGDIGVWPYPILTATEGTINMLLLILGVNLIGIFGHFSQGHVKRFLWRKFGFSSKSTKAKDVSLMTNDKYIGYRIAVNAAVLTTHLTVLSSMADVMDGQLLKHPELKIFHQLSLRYVTVWNVVFQVFYCSLALACDVTTLLGIPSTVPEKWRKFRFSIFSSLIYPVGMGVFLTFWPIFFYDRQLIFPLPADLVVTPFQNFMSHGGVFFYALCELVLLPREVTKFELKSLKTVALFSVSYLATVLYTRWPAAYTAASSAMWSPSCSMSAT